MITHHKRLPPSCVGASGSLLYRNPRNKSSQAKGGPGWSAAPVAIAAALHRRGNAIRTKGRVATDPISTITAIEGHDETYHCAVVLPGLNWAELPYSRMDRHTSRAAPQARSRAEYMREKLNFSKDVLEGLALERFETIEKGGKALKKLSEAAEWEVPTIPNATDYVMMTTDFQRHADELVKQAKAKNIDGATLAYLKLTMSCITCHKFIRTAAK